MRYYYFDIFRVSPLWWFHPLGWFHHPGISPGGIRDIVTNKKVPYEILLFSYF